jgi:FkbM family methyltransferase
MLAANLNAADPFGEAIADLLGWKPNPFFVQVGGFDGVSFDPLRPHVVDGNLSGLIFEPIPQYFEKLQALYAGSDRVKPVNVAISEADGERTIWRFNPEAVERGLLPPHFAGISSFLMEDLLKDTGVLGRSSPNAETTAALRQLVQAVPVQCRTLSGLLRDEAVVEVDILQVDTEGYDYIILKLFDFDRWRPTIVHYEHQHLGPADREAAEALLRSHGYQIHREAYDTLGVLNRAAAAAPPRTGKLRTLASTLHGEGRADDALLLLEHLVALHPDDVETLRQLVRVLGTEGRTLEAMDKLVALTAVATDTEAVVEDIRTQTLPAIVRFNEHLAAGEIEQAERYAAALAALLPGSPAMLGAALSCNQALGRAGEVARYAAALAVVEPDNAAARAVLGEPAGAPEEGDIAGRMAVALAEGGDAHPLLRLRDLHDLVGLILCSPLTDASLAQLETLLAAAHALKVEVEPGSEWEGWLTHYRVLLDAIDLAALRAPTPRALPEPDLAFVSSGGASLDWNGVRAAADKLGAQVAFFAAADESYVELYARWYALSVLKHADIPCLVVIHVIGGKHRLKAIARSVGVKDKRLIFCGDDFDPATATVAVYDAPPKGRSARPIAHYQSARFLRAGALLEALGRPMFVSDIDLLLQRGVADLMQTAAGLDVMFNENDQTTSAGSRLTANLVLFQPTLAAAALLRFLASYLERRLEGAEVTRWIDQVALILGRHHLALQGRDEKIGLFDTGADINNVMYPSYQEHPFRFLSLYHGFDTSSLEDNPRVLGEGATKS